MDAEMIYTLAEAAKYTGKGNSTLRRLVTLGILPSHKAGGRLIFRKGDLDTLLATQYPEGMTHRDIAQKYGIKRTLVIYHFQRLNVRPRTISRGQRHAAIYDEKTVAVFARILGWALGPEPVQATQNQRDGSSDHSPAASTDA